MTFDERLVQMLLSTYMGTLVPYHGVIPGKDGNLRCECWRYKKCKKENSRGKHPKSLKDGTKWYHHLSAHPEEIEAWLRRMPTMNAGLMPRQDVIVLDGDYRPEEGKFAFLELESVAGYSRADMEQTITVQSGRNPLSHHVYFRVPADVNRESLRKPHHAIDILRNVPVMSAGSRHITGNYYQFVDGRSPGEMEIAELPAWLLDHLTVDVEPKKAKAMVAVASATTTTTIITRKRELSLDDAPAPGKAISDYGVIKGLRSDRKARYLWDGLSMGDPTRDVSEDQYALALKLAFYTDHHWDQYVRLYFRSALSQHQSDTAKSNGYLMHTLMKAFIDNRSNWKQVKTVWLKPGRKRSEDTAAIIRMLEIDPHISTDQICKLTGVKRSKAKNIISRWKRDFYKNN